MSMPPIVGMPPFIYRILASAQSAAKEYAFATKAEAIRARHSVYSARKKFRRTGHPLVPAFDMLTITMPRERARANGEGTEWYWRIGENVIFETMQAQLEAQCVADGIDPTSFDPPMEAGPPLEPAPSIPLAPSRVRDDWRPSEPRAEAQRESTSSILDEMASASARKREDSDND